MYKKIVSASVAYTLLTFLQPALSLLLQPFYLHWFTPEEYAILSLLGAYSSFASLISALGIGAAVYTFYFDYSRQPDELNQYTGQVLSFCLLTNTLFALVTFAGGNFLFSIVFSANTPIAFYPYGALATLTGMAVSITGTYIVFLRNGGQLLLYAIISVLVSVGAVAAQFVLVLGAGLGLEGALWGKMLGAVAGAALPFWLHRQFLNYQLNWQYLSGSLRFMLYATPNSLIGWFYSYFDRFMVERMLNLLSVSLYSILFVFTSTIEMAYLAVRSAITPYLFASQNTADKVAESKIAHRFYFMFTILFSSVVVAVVCNLQLLTQNSAYYAVRECVFVFAAGYLISSVIDLVYVGYYREKKSKQLLALALVSVGLKIGLNYWLIPLYQIWGVVIASVITRCVLFLLLFAEPYRLKPLADGVILLLLGGMLAVMAFAHVGVVWLGYAVTWVGWLQLIVVMGLLAGTTLVQWRSSAGR